MQSKPGPLKNREEPGELCIQGFSLKKCTFLIFILANSKQLERITWIFQIVISLHLIKFNSFQKDSTFYLPIALLWLTSSCPFYSLPILLLPDWLFHFINKKQRTKDNTIGKVQKSYLFSLIDFRTKKRGNEDTTWEVYILCWSAWVEVPALLAILAFYQSIPWEAAGDSSSVWVPLFSQETQMMSGLLPLDWPNPSHCGPLGSELLDGRPLYSQKKKNPNPN